MLIFVASDRYFCIGQVFSMQESSRRLSDFGVSPLKVDVLLLVYVKRRGAMVFHDPYIVML